MWESKEQWRANGGAGNGAKTLASCQANCAENIDCVGLNWKPSDWFVKCWLHVNANDLLHQEQWDDESLYIKKNTCEFDSEFFHAILRGEE